MFINKSVRSLSDPRKMRVSAFKDLGVFSSKPDMPPIEYIDAYEPIAFMCGFYDKFQLRAVEDFLFMNGQNVLQPVSTMLLLLSLK